MLGSSSNEHLITPLFLCFLSPRAKLLVLGSFLNSKTKLNIIVTVAQRLVSLFQSVMVGTFGMIGGLILVKESWFWMV